MHTDCTSTQLVFEGLGRRAVVGRFDGGRLTTDGGVLLLREVDRRFRVTSPPGGVLLGPPRPAADRASPGDAGGAAGVGPGGGLRGPQRP